ncbi:MAG: hypothetical protein AMJ65_18325 [Phycisphaerae bacterium SG8_4]|nr:MAG: hypothetical protein AMJ65_18325 [Phycisphaerae bacterium SG8_4]
MLPSKATTNTIRPSVTGVDVAYEFSFCLLPVSCLKTCLFQRMSPVSRSKQSRRKEAPSAVEVVRNTRSSKTIGEDHPAPGTGVFQVMFEVVVQLVGTSVSCDMPCLVGPRKPGQFSAKDTRGATATNTAAQHIQTRAFRHIVRISSYLQVKNNQQDIGLSMLAPFLF